MKRANEYENYREVVKESATRKAVYQRDTTPVALASVDNDAGNKAAA